MNGATLQPVGRPGGPLAVTAIRDAQNVPFKKTEEGIEIDLAGRPQSAFATVYELRFRGPIEVVPTLPKQSENGSIDLLAADAEVHGSTAHLEGDKNAIGYWTDPKDTVGWTFDAVRREVEVEIEYACEPGSEGAEFAVEVGGQTLKGKVESTGSWATFRRVKLGKVAIVTPGKTELVVRPVNKPGQGVMNLRAVRLKP
jgi:alpha-L-fucosidase